MALSWSSLGTNYTSGLNPSLTFSSTPDAGEKILACIATRETTQTMSTPPSGYSLVASQTGTNFNAWVYEKTSDGTETSVTCTLAANSNLRISAVRLTGAAGTLSLDDWDSDATNISTSSSSGGFGSVTTTVAAAGVAAVLVMDQAFGPNDPTVSGYANTNNCPNDSTHGGIDIFTKVLSSTGTETPTWSVSGDSDQNWGALAAFKDVAGGSVESGAGSSAGSATASAVGASTAAAAGTSDGVATAAGVGASTAEAVGTAAGTATASAVGDVAGGVQSGAGSSAGTSTASGVGASTAASVGTAAGTSTAAAVGSSFGGVQEGVGTAAGHATAAGVGASTAEAFGTAAGSATASAVGADAASQIEAASLAGLRVHAAREAQFFFSKRRSAKRTSRASWPALRAA